MIIVSRSAETLAVAKAAIAQKSNVRVDVVAADLSDSANVDGLARDLVAARLTRASRAAR